MTAPKRGTELGGLVGADAICQAGADSTSLGGTWVAWLSTSTVDAKDRIPDTEYRLVDEVTVVANDKADLTDGALDHAIDQHAGGQAASRKVWTGTLSDGTAHATNHCDDWLGNLGGGRFGVTTFGDSRWTDDGKLACANILSLYCIEQ